MIIEINDWQARNQEKDSLIERQVAKILQTIQCQGEKAIIDYAMEFDQMPPKLIELKPFDEYQLEQKLADSIRLAAKRIETFAKFQMQGLKSQFYEDDFGRYGQIVQPIERIGAYIPAGRFPLISTALMTLIPARVAGCPNRVACSLADDPAVLAAASLAGATQFIQIGGVQAIAAMAYGFQSIAPVDLLVGPGNAWVNQAKKQLQSKIAIDGLAGPSELLAICDGNQPIEYLAADALAQAEHDPLACALIASDDRNWLLNMQANLEKQSASLALLESRQIELLYARRREQLVEFSERFSPEHLMLCHDGISSDQLTQYGAIFIGAASAVALGDYISGPNHTLPTARWARKKGGLSVHSFVKLQTYQQMFNQTKQDLLQSAMHIAIAEGLNEHWRSLQLRID